MAQIIQFFHPGGEPEPNDYIELKNDPNKQVTENNVKSDGELGWNCGKHNRKFLKCKGSAINKGGKSEESLYGFWGEWEANANFTKTNAEWDMPQYVFEPFINENDVKETDTWSQNTDPIVFGDNWYYSNCRQHTKSNGLYAKLRGYGIDRLEDGSIVIFGSSLRGKFVLDTVLVVERSDDYNEDNKGKLFKEGTLLNDITLSRMKDISDPAKLYTGKKCDQGATNNIIYSFVPCKPFNENDIVKSIFKRPILEMNSILPDWKDNPGGGCAQHAMLSSHDANDAKLREIWDYIKTKMFEEGLMLGIHFEEPVRKNVPQTIKNQQTSVGCGSSPKSCGQNSEKRGC